MNNEEQILHLLTNLNTRFDSLETRIGNIEQRLDNIEQRLDSLEIRMDKVEQRLDNLETDVSEIKADVKELQNKQNLLIKNFDNNVNELRKSFASVNTCANELNRKIDDLQDGFNALNDRQFITEKTVARLKIVNKVGWNKNDCTIKHCSLYSTVIFYINLNILYRDRAARHGEHTGAGDFNNAVVFQHFADCVDFLLTAGRFDYERFTVHIDDFGTEYIYDIDNIVAICRIGFYFYHYELTINGIDMREIYNFYNVD